MPLRHRRHSRGFALGRPPTATPKLAEIRRNIDRLLGDNMVAEEDVCIGDVVCLHSEDRRGFVFALQSSRLHNELAIASDQSYAEPTLPEPSALLFQICAQNRYKAAKKLPKIRAAVDADPLNIASRAALAKAKKAAAAEDNDNRTEQRRQQGKPVYYGQIVQMFHLFTEKFVHVNTTQTSFTETSNLLAELLPANGKRAQFRILPRYKVKSEGDLVQVNDLIILESVKSPGQYLHASRQEFPPTFVYSEQHELNLAVIPSGFSVVRYRSGNNTADKKLRGGSIVQIFHKEMEGYMAAEGVFGRGLEEAVHLRIRSMSTAKPRFLRPPTSAITCWRVEKETSALSGGELSWEEHIRLQHLTTRQYLLVYPDLSVSLTKDPSNPLTVFRLHPVARRGHAVTHQSYLRIQHVISHSWLHGERDEAFVSLAESRQGRPQAQQMSALRWSKAEQRPVLGLKEMMYDDAYTILLVDEGQVRNLNYVAGMVPFLQNLLAEVRVWPTLAGRHRLRAEGALVELKEFMLTNGAPDKNRQKLLRNFKVLDILVELLRCLSEESGQSRQAFVESVHAECYAIIQVYLQGFSAKNELYLAKHFPFFQSQLALWDTVGLHAAHMLMELLRDNRTIIDLVSRPQIDQFITLITKNKNYRYLELLSVLCVANGFALPENQNYIAQKWLHACPAQGHNVLDYLAMGQEVGMGRDIPYVSTDLKRTWLPLADFLKKHRGEDNEEYKFLLYQLKLFSALSQGRNSTSTGFIVDGIEGQQLDGSDASEAIYSGDVAMHVLQNGDMPDLLRAVAAENLRDLFVNSEQNNSIMDRVHLVFAYDEVGAAGGGQAVRARRGESVLSGCAHLPFLSEMKKWIRGFFEQNASMVASEVHRNELLKEVLSLVYALVNYGYYGDTEDIRKLLEPMLSLMNGRNDRPFPMGSGDAAAGPSAVLSSDVRDEIDKFREEKRFKKNRENEAVTNAKFEAMKVIDLFLNFRFTTRINRFIAEFKAVVENPADELQPFLVGQVSRGNHAQHKTASKRLHDMFKETEYFGPAFIDVLKDLLRYQQEKVTTEALVLLNRYYSAYEDLFARCIDTQILTTHASLEAYKRINSSVPKLRQLALSKWSDETVDAIVDILQEFAKLCTLDDHREPNPVNQEMLLNYDLITEVFRLLKHFHAISAASSAALDSAKSPAGRLKSSAKELGMGYEAEILRYSFRLLKGLCRANEAVQGRLFPHLNFFLAIRGADAELGEFAVELFKDNVGNCLKVEPSSITTIVRLYSGTFHPVWIAVLASLVVSDVFPIKRNQSLVVKGLMTYQECLAVVTETPAKAKLKLLATEEKGVHNARHQLASLVYLFSMCSVGENKSIESICQCLLSMEELLGAINLKGLCDGLRMPFLSFLTTGYLHSFSTAARAEINKHGGDPALGKFIRSTAEQLRGARALVAEDKDVALEVLKHRPANLHRSRADAAHEKKETLHYVFDGLLPFLYALFERHWNSTIPVPTDVVRDILDELGSFAAAVAPCLSRPHHRTQLLNTLRLISHTASVPVSLPHALTAQAAAVVSPARQAYQKAYAQELSLNERFDAFARSIELAYEGKNTVRQQIGVPLDWEYTEPGSEESLPLGEEFQQLIACFLVQGSGKKERKFDVSGLIRHLSASIASVASLSEKESREMELLDVKCLKLLRGMMHNEVVRLPKSKSHNPGAYQRVMKELKTLQGSLDSQGLVPAVLPHLRRSHSQAIVREVFNLLKALYKGNSKTPDTFVQYIHREHEEAFFVAVQGRLHSTASLIKEHRFIHSLHQRSLSNTATLLKAASSVGRGGRDGEDALALLHHRLDKTAQPALNGISNLTSFIKNKLEGGGGDEGALEEAAKEVSASKVPSPVPGEERNGSTVHLVPGELGGRKSQAHSAHSAQQHSLASNGTAPFADDPPEQVEMELPDLSAYQDLGDVRVVLRTLQSLCDLEFRDAQELMREQPENVKSVNLVGEVTALLAILYTNLDAQHVELISEILETLIEMCQGNPDNQGVVFDSKVVDYLNHMVRTEEAPDVAADDALRLRTAIAVLIKFLTEENLENPTKPSQSGMILGTVNVEGVWQTAQDAYRRTGDESLTREQRLEGLEMGFVYFGLLRRAIDLRLATPEALEEANPPAWKFYQDRSMSLELIKGGELQRLHFRVTDAKALRAEVEEKLKWEVDRSSYGNKMRDFMSWIKDIHEDILYQRRIHSHALGRFFVRRWRFFNYVVLATTMVMNLLMLILWKKDVTRSTSLDDFWLYHSESYDIPWRICGSVHNVASFALVISYFLSNAAGFVSSYQSYVRKFKRINRLMVAKGEVDPNDRPSKLEVSIVGVQTIYYVMFLGFSLAGTVLSPAFFAFHLVQIVANNQLLTRVIRAVTVNGKSLMWVAFLGLIIIYIYALVAFLTFRFIYEDNLHLCNTLWQCTLTTIREGLVYRTMRIDYPLRDKPCLRNQTHHLLSALPEAGRDSVCETTDNESFNIYGWKILWDISFFIVILTIGLNVIFGIIVDTFRQLRDAKWRIEQDMDTRCFICGRNSYEFEQKGISFRYHSGVEHNMLSYVFFFVRLQDSPTEDLSHLEMFIKRMLKSEDFNFFPLGRAMSLLDKEREETALERDLLMMKQMEHIMKRMEQEEWDREKAALKRRQEEWERGVKGRIQGQASPPSSRRPPLAPIASALRRPQPRGAPPLPNVPAHSPPSGSPGSHSSRKTDTTGLTHDSRHHSPDAGSSPSPNSFKPVKQHKKR